MIKTVKLTNCAPFQQAEIFECKKVNFIFGANGSGKSTISSFLAGVSDPRYTSSSIEWEGEFHEVIEVYNKAFRTTNLQQEIPGVFTIGSATIDEINSLNQLKSELEHVTKEFEKNNTAYQNKETEKSDRENQFKENAWLQILKKYETDFQKAFEGLRGSKDKFVAELKRRIQRVQGHEGNICKLEELIQRARILYASNLEKRSKFVLDIDKFLKGINDIRNDSIWGTVIAGSKDVDIAALINELNNTSWVWQGRQYLRDGSKRCPFCQQDSITEDFRRKLELFFEEEYKQKTDRIAKQFNAYQHFSKQIIEAIDAILQDKDGSIQTGRLNLDVFAAKKELLRAVFETNAKKMEEKNKDPGNKIVIEDVSDIVTDIQNLLNDANVLIDDHNGLVDKQDTEKNVLRDDIWTTLIHEESGLINAYQQDITNFDKALNNIKKVLDSKKIDISNLKLEIEKKSKIITSVQPAIDEINRSLKAYGFTNFSIYPAEGKENYYCIKRDDGTLVNNTLSEGEETFLSFLYFMQRVKGSKDQAHSGEKKIIVLDDPISSLDSTILYVVGAMVRELAQNTINGKEDVQQLFVLTHNVFFHKEASFIDGRTKELSDVNYWIIRKNRGIAEIDAYAMKNPISTSYELLWQELKDNSRVSQISIQNIMRRIMENYFRILGKRRDDCLVETFETVEDKMIAKSLLHWINDGSHSIPDDLFIDSYTDAVPRYKKVFRELFEKSGHLQHYNMMMQIDDSEE